MRIAKDILWVILIAVTPWFIFERFFLDACERAVQIKRTAESEVGR